MNQRRSCNRAGVRWAWAVALTALGLLALHPPPADARFGDRALRRGSHGHDVRVLQRWLGLVGFKTSVDGRFGRRTVRTVRRYERALKLRVDGRVSRLQAAGLRKRAYAVRAQRVLAPATAPAVMAADGRTAVAPPAAPEPVKAVLATANAIVTKPYRYGGGHASFEDTAYDCSGAVSYALHGAGMLTAPLDSSGLMRFGAAGPGRWISVLAHADHAYIVIAGLRFDTSGVGEDGPRWRPEPRSSRGYTVRHPAGL